MNDRIEEETERSVFINIIGKCLFAVSSCNDWTINLVLPLGWHGFTDISRSFATSSDKSDRF